MHGDFKIRRNRRQAPIQQLAQLILAKQWDPVRDIYRDRNYFRAGEFRVELTTDRGAPVRSFTIDATNRRFDCLGLFLFTG